MKNEKILFLSKKVFGTIAVYKEICACKSYRYNKLDIFDLFDLYGKERGYFISIYFIQNSMGTEEVKGISLPELFQKLSSSEKGLTDSEEKERLQLYGPNEIVEKKISPVVKFLSYFWGPIPYC